MRHDELNVWITTHHIVHYHIGNGTRCLAQILLHGKRHTFHQRVRVRRGLMGMQNYHGLPAIQLRHQRL